MAAKRPQGRRSRRWPLRRRSRHPACSLTADCLAHQPKRRLAPRRMPLLPARRCRSRRSSLRRRSRHPACSLTADCLAHQPKQRLAPRRMALLRARGCRSRRSSLRRRSQHPACPLTAARVASQPGRRTQPAILSTAATNPRRGATFLRLSGATSGYATEDAAVTAICCPGAAGPRPICCTSTTCCQSPRAVARTCSTYFALRITACATAMGRLCRRNAPCSASSALQARRSTRLGDGSQVDVAGGTPFASARIERASSLPHHQILAVVYRLRPSRYRRSAPSATIRSAAPLADRL